MNPHQHSPNATATTFDCWQTPPPTPLRIDGLPQQPVWSSYQQFVSTPLNWQHSTPFSQREESQYGTPCYRTPTRASPSEDVEAVVKTLLDEKLAQLEESVDLLCYSTEKSSPGRDSPVCPRRISSTRLARLIMSYSEEHREAVNRAASVCEHPLERHILNTPSGQLRVLDELSSGQSINDRMPGGSDGPAIPNVDLSENSILNSSLFESPSFLLQTTIDDGAEEPQSKMVEEGKTNYIFGDNAFFDRSSIGTPCQPRPDTAASAFPNQAIDVRQSVWSTEFVQKTDNGRTQCQGDLKSDNEESDSSIETDDSVVSEVGTTEEVVVLEQEPEDSPQQASQVDCSDMFEPSKVFKEEVIAHCSQEPTVDDVEMVDQDATQGDQDVVFADVIQNMATSNTTTSQVYHRSEIDQSIVGRQSGQDIFGHHLEAAGRSELGQDIFGNQSGTTHQLEAGQDVSGHQSETTHQSEVGQDVCGHQSETTHQSEVGQDVFGHQSETTHQSEVGQDVYGHQSETTHQSEVGQDVFGHQPAAVHHDSNLSQDVSGSETSEITVSHDPLRGQDTVGHFSDESQGAPGVDLNAAVAAPDQVIDIGETHQTEVASSDTGIYQSGVAEQETDANDVVQEAETGANDVLKEQTDTGMDDPVCVPVIDEDMECEDGLESRMEGEEELREVCMEQNDALPVVDQSDAVEMRSAQLPAASASPAQLVSRCRQRRQRRTGKRETTTVAATEKKRSSSSITPWKMRTRSSNTQSAPVAKQATPARRGRPSKLAPPPAKRRPVKAAGKTAAKKPVKRAAAVPEENTRRSKRNKPPKRASKAESAEGETVAAATAQSQQPKRTAGRGRAAKPATAPVRTSRRNLRSSAKEENVTKK